MTDIRSLVALATYNEIETLPSLIEEIWSQLPSAHILVVDDNSPDGTGQWCDERSASETRLSCLHRASKLGLGSATLEAFRWALEREYEVIVTLDADGSHDPCHLPALVEATQRADVAIGSRYCEGGAIEGWPLGRRLLSRAINTIGRSLLQLPVRDTSGAFRAYRAAVLRRIDLERIESAGYAYLEEILWHLARAGAKFEEVPITFHQRRAGRSKTNLREATGKIRTIGTLGWRSLVER